MRKKIFVAVAGLLLAFPVLAAAHSGGSAGGAKPHPAKLTVTMHYEEIFHLSQSPSPGMGMHGTADAKLIVDLSFERPIVILPDVFLTPNGAVNMTGNAVYSASESFVDDNGDGGTTTGQAHLAGGLDPGQGDLVTVDPLGGDGLRVNIAANFTLQGKDKETNTLNGDRSYGTVMNRLQDGFEYSDRTGNDGPAKAVGLGFGAEIWPPGGDPDDPDNAALTLSEASKFESETWVGAQPRRTADGGWHLQYTGHKTQISPSGDPASIHATRTLVVDVTITPQ